MERVTAHGKYWQISKGIRIKGKRSGFTLTIEVQFKEEPVSQRTV